MGQVREAATLVREQLQQLQLRSWLKTSGGRGLHLVVPLAARWPVDTVRRLAEAMVRHLAAAHPQHLVARSGEQHRVGRIFVDWLRNSDGATTVAPYSLRARPGLGVAMPVPWEALPSLDGAAQWTIATAPAHLAKRTVDPWGDLAAHKESLAPALQALAVPTQGGG